MEINIYTIRDSKGEIYQQPFFFRNDADASRFIKQILDSNPKDLPGWYQNLCKFPEDFDLFITGKFDDTTGKIHNLDTPEHVIKCNVLIKPKVSDLN